MKALRLCVPAAALLISACTSNSAGKTEPRKAEGLEDIQRGDKRADGKKAKKPAGKPLAPVPNEAVASVNGVEISNADFRHIYDLKVRKYVDRGKEMPVTADRRYRRSIVERLIYHELLRQEAEKLGISYDEADLEQRVARQKEGIEDWAAHLRRRGESDASLEAIYKKELLELAILEARGELEVTEEDLQAEYEKFKTSFDKPVERIRVSHILVRIGPDPRDPNRPKGKPTEAQQKKWEAEALAKAKELAAKARAPEADFAAIATESSDGPSARKGGDLNIVQPDRMPEEFSKVAFALQPGVVSEPVKTKFGFHIIKVAEKYPAGLLPLEAVRDQLRERLELTKLRNGRQQLRQQLIEAAKIVNKMDEWLGPDPRARRPTRGPHDPHGGHGRQPADAQPDPQPKGAVDGAVEPVTVGRQPEGQPKPADPKADESAVDGADTAK